MAQIAEAAGLGSTRLHELFRQHVGGTPLNYQLRLRLEQAREALRDPGVSVIDAAMRLGFCSSAHFAARFKAHFGLTPTAWRRQTREEKRGSDEGHG